MGRLSKKTVKEIELLKLKELIRGKILLEYGSVAAFIGSEKGEEVGGKKIRTYLYDGGNVSLDVMIKLCEYFNIGELSRKLEIVKKYTYYLKEVKT